MSRLFRSCILSLSMFVPMAMQAAHAVSESAALVPAEPERLQQLAAELQTAREQMSRQASQQAELSQALAKALASCEVALQRQDAVAAREALLPLEAYAPLLNFPSLNLQWLAGRVSALEGRRDLVQEHAARAAVLLMHYREAKGMSEDSPMEFWNQFELREWAGASGMRMQDVRALTGSRELRGEFIDKDGQKQVRYLLPRQRSIQAYDPIDDAALNDERRQAIADARKERDEFLDSKVPYLRLLEAIRKATKEADALFAAQQFAQALARLEQLNEFYPLDRIPSIQLLSRISLSAGNAGDLKRQQALRLHMFGLQQVLARSGDGAKPASAVEVAFVTDEYVWLQAHELKPLTQRLLPGEDVGLPGRSFDALDVEGPQGKRTVYFDVTRLFRMYKVRDTQ